jgi:hypothetical protein
LLNNLTSAAGHFEHRAITQGVGTYRANILVTPFFGRDTQNSARDVVALARGGPAS